MPFKDPEVKKHYMKRYRAHSIENGYGKWLYKRRATHLADAQYFRKALEDIEAVSTEESVHLLVHDALSASKERWRELGPSPGASLKEVPKRADTILEALAKLELES